jgi:hypothetical protein
MINILAGCDTQRVLDCSAKGLCLTVGSLDHATVDWSTRLEDATGGRDWSTRLDHATGASDCARGCVSPAASDLDLVLDKPLNI